MYIQCTCKFVFYNSWLCTNFSLSIIHEWYTYVYVWECECECVCVRKREREREREFVHKVWLLTVYNVVTTVPAGLAAGDPDSPQGSGPSSAVSGSGQTPAESAGLATSQQGQLCEGLWSVEDWNIYIHVYVYYTIYIIMFQNTYLNIIILHIYAYLIII